MAEGGRRVVSMIDPVRNGFEHFQFIYKAQA